jgi:hypothetical protein
VIICVIASRRTLYNSREMNTLEFGRSEHSLDLACPHLLGHNVPKADIFSAFLDELIVGDWASQVSKETELISPHADKAHCLHARSKSGLFPGDAALSVIVGVESSSCVSTSELHVPLTRSKASPQTGVKSSSRANGAGNGEKAVADAPGTPEAAFVGNAILSLSYFRKLSSTTYLRRMHLSRNDATALFPECKETVEFIFATDTTRCVSPEQFKVQISVSLHDGEGRRWPVVLECLRSAGQRHVRLNKGWSEMSRANAIYVGKRIRLARWEQTSSSSDAIVTVTIV